MSKFMYWFGIVLAIVCIIGGIVSLILGAGVISLVVILLAYILMVLLDIANKYLESNR